MSNFEFIGGQLALDYVNTVDWVDGDALVRERLNSYEDLVAWAEAAKVISSTGGRNLRAEAKRNPREGEAALAEGIVLRRVLRGIFTSLAQGREPSKGDIDSFNSGLQETFNHLYLDCSAREMTWSCEREKNDLRQMLWPVMWAASTLLTAETLKGLRECSGEVCGWLFLDQSKNGSRRWCDMTVCGNRAKAKRHYHRKKPAR